MTPTKSSRSGSSGRERRTSFNETVKVVSPQPPVVREGEKMEGKKGGGKDGGGESTVALKGGNEKRSRSREGPKRKNRRPFWRRREEQKDPSKKTGPVAEDVRGRSPTPLPSARKVQLRK